MRSMKLTSYAILLSAALVEAARDVDDHSIFEAKHADHGRRKDSMTLEGNPPPEDSTEPTNDKPAKKDKPATTDQNSQAASSNGDETNNNGGSTDDEGEEAPASQCFKDMDKQDEEYKDAFPGLDNIMENCVGEKCKHMIGGEEDVEVGEKQKKECEALVTKCSEAPGMSVEAGLTKDLLEKLKGTIKSLCAQKASNVLCEYKIGKEMDPEERTFTQCHPASCWDASKKEAVKEFKEKQIEQLQLLSCADAAEDTDKPDTDGNKNKSGNQTAKTAKSAGVSLRAFWAWISALVLILRGTAN